MSIRNQTGTSYVEYFIAAAAMAVATLAVLGRLNSAVGPHELRFNAQMQAIAGP